MDLQTLMIVAALAPLMVLMRILIRRIFKASDAIDIYTLSDAKGHKIEVVLKKQASAEERAYIINEKVRELTRQQTA